MEAIDTVRFDVPQCGVKVTLDAAPDIDVESADVVTRLKALTCRRVVAA